MTAFIFAAGLGTRLKPFTDYCPKALVKLNGQPLIWHTIAMLKKCGINKLVVNVHHFSEMLVTYLKNNDFGIPVFISDESEQLLDTGGALLYAKRFLEGSEPFIAINVDIISSVDLQKVIDFHNKKNPLSTIVVRKRETNRQLLFDNNDQLTGWKNFETGEEKITSKYYYYSNPFAFSGIHIISQRIFDLIIEKGKFSVIDLYLRLSSDNAILGYIDNSDFWLDLGKPGQLELAEQYLKS